MATSNPESAKYAGVNVDHPRIVETIKNAAKRGLSKEATQKVVGMPREVIDRHYNSKEYKVQ